MRIRVLIINFLWIIVYLLCILLKTINYHNALFIIHKHNIITIDSFHHKNNK